MPDHKRLRFFEHEFDKDNPKFQSRKDLEKQLGIPQGVVDIDTFNTRLTVALEATMSL
ncbi:MAG: hypothetical protein ACTJGF_04670 [Corynebacterium sp.]|uniref:hypothetical protein n=1 Tax=Corynebacterium casei TaxID=160386 RepID=UPI000A577CA7|nr:hypothetical protein [Corynebacterium casei]